MAEQNDYQQIMNLIGRYGQTVDDWPRRPDDYAALFTEDGQFTDNGVTVGPGQKILDLMRFAAKATREEPQLAGTRHLQLNPIIDVDGDSGTGSVDLVVLELSPDDGWRIRGSGRYTDEYVRGIDGTWRFRSRTIAWFKDAGPDPRQPDLAGVYASLFHRIMSDDAPSSQTRQEEPKI